MTPDKEDRQRAFGTLIRLLGAAVAAGVLVGLIALPGLGSAGVLTKNAANSLDQPMSKSLAPPPERTTVYAADGTVIAQFFYHNRESVRLDQIAPIMQKAVIAIEDSRFYEHGPLDVQGTLRALITNAQAGGVRQGGSTLTQQYVKNLLVENATTDVERQKARAPNLARKLRELRYAVNVEKQLTKDQILEGYLNVAYFGSGAYGVQAAAQRYFSVDAKDLELQQAALLAGITNSPTAFDPNLHPKAARGRRDTVLNRMRQLHIITKQQAEHAKSTKIVLHMSSPKADCVDSTAPFFCEYVKNEILGNPAFGKTAKERQRLLYRGGLTVRTTLDTRAQKAARRVMSMRPSKTRDAAEAMIEPGTGKIKAMVVSSEYGDDPSKGQTTLNLAADAAHGGNGGYQIGSTAKIFTLAAALKEGIPVKRSFNSPYSMTVSGYRDCEGNIAGVWPSGSWTLHNTSKSEKGSYNLRTGTLHSINTFFAQLEREAGLCNVVKVAKAFGMRQANGKPVPDNQPSFTLGTGQYDVAHLAAAYAGFAARGKYCTPIAITDVTDAQGKKIKVPQAKCTQAIPTDIADEVNKILSGVLTKGTARGNGLGRPAAGKTGTCEGYACALFAGYTPDLAAAVWYGDADSPFGNPDYGVFGSNIAPLWKSSMLGALHGTPPTPFHTPIGQYGENTDAKVPDVTGTTVAAATSKLQASGFSVTVSPRAVVSALPKGQVAYTSPSAGTMTDQSSEIILFVSSGQRQSAAHGHHGKKKGRGHHH